MIADQIKASLNLYAVLKNLEDLGACDPEMNALIRQWDIRMRFSVLGGPRAHIVFKDGSCAVGEGPGSNPDISLFFVSPAHLNKMMDGKGIPILLKGVTRFKFLTGDFARLTERLEYYLKPTDDLLENENYLALNTRMMMNTAAFAVPEIGMRDPVGELVAPQIRNGTVQLFIEPDGPAVHIRFADGRIEAGKGPVDHPSALMTMKTMKIANDFLNGRIDAFTAIASGDVSIKGQTPMLDSLSLMFDRIPHYLS